ncbi:MAG TPA: hypothetical protein PK299_12995 [Anaerolineales bacterium]|nr:hypothetical protein [Anaerolineales bacterium]
MKMLQAILDTARNCGFFLKEKSANLTRVGYNQSRAILLLAWLMVLISGASWAFLQSQAGTVQAAPFALPTVTPTRTPVVTCPPVCKVFLPLVVKEYPWKGVSGWVTFEGNAISGIIVTLQREQGGTWSNLLTVVTNAAGEYAFPSAPALGVGEKYRVVYSNSTDYTKLRYWQTEALSSYTAQQNVQLTSFDVSDIALLTPANGSVLSPTAFSLTWQVRAASPSDVYQVYFYNTIFQKVAESSPVGYAGSVSFTALPSGLNPNTDYQWGVTIAMGDGRMGESYYRRTVRWEEPN